MPELTSAACYSWKQSRQGVTVETTQTGDRDPALAQGRAATGADRDVPYRFEPRETERCLSQPGDIPVTVNKSIPIIAQSVYLRNRGSSPAETHPPARTNPGHSKRNAAPRSFLHRCANGYLPTRRAAHCQVRGATYRRAARAPTPLALPKSLGYARRG
jgi:hypothetical protein